MTGYGRNAAETRMARKQTHNDFDPDDFDPDDFDPASDGESGRDADGGGSGTEQLDTGYCPDCGAEIYDASDICPKCFAWIDGDTSRHSPRRRRAADRWTRLVVWALIGAIATGLGIFALLGLGR